MTTIDTTAAGLASAQPGAAAGATTAAKITSDFETFLRMLTVQLENQDPLNPVDSADYAVQLATFSGVEQQVQTNDLLTALSAQIAVAGMADLASWVGKEVRAAMPAYFDGSSPITIAPNPAAAADRVELIITDQWGTEVSRRELPVSDASFRWDGLSASGQPLPTGTYGFSIVSFANGDVLRTDPAEVFGVVEEIRSDGTQNLLVLPGGVTLPSTDVTALRLPDG